MLGHWRIEDDEAILIDVKPPDTIYWNFTIENIWHESVDYMHITNSLTKANVEYGADGRVRFVIAKSDPGTPNWLNTGGVNRGFMTFRWLDARNMVLDKPVVRRVKLEELKQAVAGV